MKGLGAKFLGVALATIAGFYIYDNYIASSELVGGAEEAQETFRGRRFGGNQARGRRQRLQR